MYADNVCYFHQDKYIETKKQVMSLETEFEKIQVALQQSQSQASSLETRLQASQELVQSLTTDVEGLREERSKLEGSEAQLQETLTTAKQRCAEVENDLARTQTQLQLVTKVSTVNI